MSFVYKQPFVKVLRKIEGVEQKYFEVQYNIYLYETKIETPVNTFHLKDIFDISYRHSNAKYGTLYLHTNQGVFPYNVCTAPDEFIFLVKSMKFKYK